VDDRPGKGVGVDAVVYARGQRDQEEHGSHHARTQHRLERDVRQRCRMPAHARDLLRRRGNGRPVLDASYSTAIRLGAPSASGPRAHLDLDALHVRPSRGAGAERAPDRQLGRVTDRRGHLDQAHHEPEQGGERRTDGERNGDRHPVVQGHLHHPDASEKEGGQGEPEPPASRIPVLTAIWVTGDHDGRRARPGAAPPGPEEIRGTAFRDGVLRGCPAPSR
jgi:hypothetical protein